VAGVELLEPFRLWTDDEVLVTSLYQRIGIAEVRRMVICSVYRTDPRGPADCEKFAVSCWLRMSPSCIETQKSFGFVPDSEPENTRVIRVCRAGILIEAILTVAIPRTWPEKTTLSPGE
jgi:hypothetical protein